MRKRTVGTGVRSHRIELSGDLDRRSAEILALEIRALAKRHGLEVQDVRVVSVTKSPQEEDQENSR
jgi:type IV pilus biogenesis protein CpaD/CtpE